MGYFGKAVPCLTWFTLRLSHPKVSGVLRALESIRNCKSGSFDERATQTWFDEVIDPLGFSLNVILV